MLSSDSLYKLWIDITATGESGNGDVVSSEMRMEVNVLVEVWGLGML